MSSNVEFSSQWTEARHNRRARGNAEFRKIRRLAIEEMDDLLEMMAGLCWFMGWLWDDEDKETRQAKGPRSTAQIASLKAAKIQKAREARERKKARDDVEAGEEGSSNVTEKTINKTVGK